MTSRNRTPTKQNNSIPPPFGASSGLEALFPHFPHPQFPLGRDLPIPHPSPWTTSPLGDYTWAGLLWPPEPFQDRSKKSIIFFINVLRLKHSRLLANMPREGLYETRGYPGGGHGPNPYDVPPPRWCPWIPTPSQKRGGKKHRNRRWHRHGPRTDEVPMPRWI